MNMKEAWEATQHGKAFFRMSSGIRIEKWMGEKPGLTSSFDRFLFDSASGGSLTANDLVANDWEVEA